MPELKLVTNECFYSNLLQFKLAQPIDKLNTTYCIVVNLMAMIKSKCYRSPWRWGHLAEGPITNDLVLGQ